MPANNTEIEKRLWGAADELRANSRLKASEYSVPVLGLIFLRYADHKFAHAEREIRAERVARAGGRRQRPITRDDYHARGVLYIPDEARFEHLVFMVVMVLSLLYFIFFFQPKTRVGRGVSYAGRLAMMIGFGAMFGNTVNTRLSWLSPRIGFLLDDWLGKLFGT